MPIISSFPCGTNSKGTIPNSTLNDNTWEVIRTVSDEGNGANYWAVGDTKEVLIDGKIGTLEVNLTYWVYILGFNHNSDIEGCGIHFGTFKTAQTNGVDVCLVDNNVEELSTDGTLYFSMNHFNATDSSGWSACDARYDILGSTNTEPPLYGMDMSMVIKGTDAPSNTPINCVENTLMAALPSDLRNVMKPIKKFSTYFSDGIAVQCADYLPLLSEFEIFGEIINSYKIEQYCQKQYQYFINGNSKIKCAHDSQESYITWWTRSSNRENFCAVDSNGSSVYKNKNISYGIAPVFMV